MTTEYYELRKVILPDPQPDEFRIATAAVWSCALCCEMIDGMGGPGNGEICVKCGEDIKHGHIRYDRAAHAALESK